MKEWAKQYETKSWTKYEVTVWSDDYKKLSSLFEKSDLVCCGEESPMAEEFWELVHSVEGLFFYDTEQIIGMGMDAVYGVSDFGILTKEWRGNPAGSLVLSVYSGVTKNPPTVTVGVAR